MRNQPWSQVAPWWRFVSLMQGRQYHPRRWSLHLGIALLVISGCGETPIPAAPPMAPAHIAAGSLPASLPLDRDPEPVLALNDPAPAHDGLVWMWGRTGAGMPFSQRVAGDFARVGELTKIVAVGAGLKHGLALDVNGNVWAWDESTTARPAQGDRAERVDVRDIVAVAAGDQHNLALHSDGSLWAWGDNVHGQLGDGTNEARSTPVPVIGLREVVAISAGGKHSLAVLSDGTVRSWGLGALGRLGTGDSQSSNVPVLVPGLVDVTVVAAGGQQSLALARDGRVWSWGYALLGDETEVSTLYTRPVPVEGLPRVVAVAAGWSHSLALGADGQVWAWGYNSSGELGDGWARSIVVDGKEVLDVARGEPAPVPGLEGVVAIAAGEHHSLALRSDGQVWAWGSNAFGELGSSRTRDPSYRAASGPVPTLHGVSAIAARGVHSLAVVATGRQLPPPRFAR